MSELISNLPTKYDASVLNDNVIKINNYIHEINDMHSIKINDDNSVRIFELYLKICQILIIYL